MRFEVQLQIDNYNHLFNIYPNNWVILIDEGYQRSGNFIKCVTPIKNASNCILSFDYHM